MSVVKWLALYGALALLPLSLALVEPLPPGRGVWIEFGVGLGFVGMALLGMQFVLSARFRRVAAPFGLDIILQFHRGAGLVAAAFILAHPVVLFLAEPFYLSYLDPREMGPRAWVLILLTLLLLVVVLLPFWRARLGVRYEIWRASHSLFALVVVLGGMLHALNVEYYVADAWRRVVWTALCLVPAGLLAYVRAVKPALMRRRPWQVVEVRPEAGRTWTVVVEPVGHAGMSFRAGQFAWVTIGRSPFLLDEHPFSIASSAAQMPRLEFAVKELGDFTAGIGHVPRGTPAYLDGPYGAFVLDDADQGGVVMIAGGVGIAPVMSLLRTLRDRRDPRPVLLIYACRAPEAAAFRQELDELPGRLALRIVYVWEESPPGSTDETGWVTRELLERHLPGDPAVGAYFVCGPPPMMDAVEQALVDLRVAMRKVRSERFHIA